MFSTSSHAQRDQPAGLAGEPATEGRAGRPPRTRRRGPCGPAAARDKVRLTILPAFLISATSSAGTTISWISPPCSGRRGFSRLERTLLHAVVGVDDVPLAGLGPRLAAEGLERVVLVGVDGRVLLALTLAGVGLRVGVGVGGGVGVVGGLRRRLLGASSATSSALVGDRLSAVGDLLDARPRRPPRPATVSSTTSTVSAGVSSAVGSCSMSDCDTSTPYLSSGTSSWTGR